MKPEFWPEVEQVKEDIISGFMWAKEFGVTTEQFLTTLKADYQIMVIKHNDIRRANGGHLSEEKTIQQSGVIEAINYFEKLIGE